MSNNKIVCTVIGIFLHGFVYSQNLNGDSRIGNNGDNSQLHFDAANNKTCTIGLQDDGTDGFFFRVGGVYRLYVNEDGNVTFGNWLNINDRGSTGSLSMNAEVENDKWKISNKSYRASTIEMRNSGVVEIYGTNTIGQADWKQMFGVDAPNDKAYFPNGNLGIGTTNLSENYKLVIKQEASSPQYGMRILNSTESKSMQFWIGTGGAVIDAEGSTALHLRTAGHDRIFVSNSGNVGIGETNPTYKLTVDGIVSAKEVKVSSTPNSDYVFEPDYDLKPLHEVDQFIQENKHLPDIPSAEEFRENGVGLGEMDDMLLRKVEELTLYVIELKKSDDQKAKMIYELKKENENQAKEIQALKTRLN
jgi:hypothetical protein